MSVDPAALTGAWNRAWPQCPPIGHLLRRRLPDRWVRFHSLPLGKRYPTSAEEYGEVIARYNAVIEAVTGESRTDTINVVTPQYGPRDTAAGTEPVFVGLHPGAVRWMHAVDPDDPEVSYELHVSRQRFTPGDLDDLLRYVAEDRTSEVVITDAALSWLIHPYDGGVDVIAPSVCDRDRFAARFGSWLSARPDGL